jgi:UDP-GlcNAc:undecaprenyl-phosphate/decaprenyl-phosphate GlcNAc-1-phosphate transferase
MTMWLYAFLVSFVTAVAATWIMIRVRIADNPDAARKLHGRVTPTSGGIGIIAGTMTGLGFLGFWGALPDSPILFGCLGLACTGGLLGLFDDIFVLGAKRKLFVMLLVTSVFVVLFARIETLVISASISIPLGPIIGGVGTVFWLLVMVNTVNFMDGANGLSIGCSAIGLASISGLIALNGDAQVAILGWVIGGACIGFLVWNAFTGSIFAGDSGALFVGLMCGAFGTWGVTLGVNPLLIAMCFLPLLVDVILTVLLRLARRQNVLEPHSEHAYQRLIKAGLSHLSAARFYWLRSLFCGLLALWAQYRGGWMPAGIFALLLIALCANQLMIRRQATRALAQLQANDPQT